MSITNAKTGRTFFIGISFKAGRKCSLQSRLDIMYSIYKKFQNF